ncbi:H-NS family nucleoid-associated regulatory protein [Bradyrhizobium sp. AZCC 2262]|uniref:H-NS family nucleoid-associated regulatory protein n=1 Tax=Bradyrhizobium sp. AZCC 2262 TaxID=3117022 RepID=UPI003FA5C19A
MNRPCHARANIGIRSGRRRLGRGKKPRWLAAHLKSGKRIDDFRISHAAQADQLARLASAF